MRRLISVVAGVALAGGAISGGLAADRAGHTPVNCIDSVSRNIAVSTSSRTFTKVPGLADSPESIFPIIINVSALVAGAPVEFRVLSTNIGGQTHTSQPGLTRFVSGSGANSFSYQWVEANSSTAVHVNDLRLQWRSTSGKAVHLLRGDMAVSYDTTKGACSG